jgi:dTDP-glucose 4,6-dehydratase
VSQKVLVTGADGFIGSHLTETLVSQGYSVRALVQYNSFNHWGWLENLEPSIKNSIDIQSGDIRDPFFVNQLVKGCDKILHLAALIAIPYSYVAPASYLQTNIQGSLNMVQAAKEHGIERFIHTSTSEVYGTAQFVPITEEHPLQAQSPYAASKIAADQMVMSYYHSFETPVITLRPFNTYGPRQSARAIIPTVISQIVDGSNKIKLGALHPTRDFNFIKDTVSGFIAALNAEQGVGEVINLGSNYEISIGDTVKIIAELMGTQIQIEQDQQRLRPTGSEVERLWADNSKAWRLLNWSPSYAKQVGLKKGLKETIDWFTNPENLSHYKTQVYNV